MRKPIVVFASLVGVQLLASVAIATEPPASQINPQSGLIETVDATWNGSNYEIRHTVSEGSGQHVVATMLSSNAVNDLDPRLAISPGGDTWVAWWRPGSLAAVLIRKRTYATASWDSERLIGQATEDNSHPRIAFDGISPWAAYEIHDGEATEIGVDIIVDDPSPIGTRTIVGSTSYSGDRDLTISAEAGHLWVTWVDSSSNVAWSSYSSSSQSWNAPQYESYVSDGVESARTRIRARILAN